MTTKKTFAQTLVLPALLVSLAAPAATEFDQPGDGPFFGETAPGQWLIGGKFASMRNSDDGMEHATNAGIILGYEFARPVWKGKAAFEFEYLPSTKWGDVNRADASNPSVYPEGGRWENPVYSGYFAYRTPGRIYAKGKIGVVATRFKVETVYGPQTEEVVTDLIPVLDENGDQEMTTARDENNDPILNDDGTVKMVPLNEEVIIYRELVGPEPGTPRIIQENKTQLGYGLGLGVHIGKHFDLEFEYEGNQGKAQLYNFGVNAIVKFP